MGSRSPDRPNVYDLCRRLRRPPVVDPRSHQPAAQGVKEHHQAHARPGSNHEVVDRGLPQGQVDFDHRLPGGGARGGDQGGRCSKVEAINACPRCRLIGNSFARLSSSPASSRFSGFLGSHTLIPTATLASSHVFPSPKLTSPSSLIDFTSLPRKLKSSLRPHVPSLPAPRLATRAPRQHLRNTSASLPPFAPLFPPILLTFLRSPSPHPLS